ncbi:MAG TPA: hypothetical protein VFL83_22020 [Anaeromyxobacter sp.]|nr:hypothetical protein [Anaeromyxobacter sp.]
MEAALPVLLAAAAIDVPAGGELAAALARARPGDAVRLGPGQHRGSLGRLSGVTISGAGAGSTTVLAPEGQDGAVVVGDAVLSGLALVAGPERCGVKVLGGAARLDDVALAGGACGAFLDGGRLDGRGVDLAGGYGLLVRRGEATLDMGSARGTGAAVGLLGGAVSLRRFAVAGPAREGGISIAGGSARLEGVVVRAPGPSGISVAAGARLEAVEVTVAGATEAGGALGDCVQAIRADVRVHGATLVRCAGAAVEASGGTLALSGVDAAGGSAGCLVLVNGATADLSGNLCAGRGPGLVAASGARATARVNRWWTDPVFWVDCGSGSRVALGRGETAKEPCAAAR